MGARGNRSAAGRMIPPLLSRVPALGWAAGACALIALVQTARIEGGPLWPGLKAELEAAREAQAKAEADLGAALGALAAARANADAAVSEAQADCAARVTAARRSAATRERILADARSAPDDCPSGGLLHGRELRDALGLPAADALPQGADRPG